MTQLFTDSGGEEWNQFGEGLNFDSNFVLASNDRATADNLPFYPHLIHLLDFLPKEMEEF